MTSIFGGINGQPARHPRYKAIRADGVAPKRSTGGLLIRAGCGTIDWKFGDCRLTSSEYANLSCH